MKLPQYAKQKRGTIYYQRRVPLDVRRADPFASMPAVYEKSLKTTNLSEALREFADIHDWFNRQLEAVRAGTSISDDPAPTPGVAPVTARKRDQRWADFYAREEYERLVQSTKLRLKAARIGREGAEESLDDWLDFEVSDLNTSIDQLRRRDYKIVRRAALAIFAAERVIRLEPMRTAKDHKKRYPIEDTDAFHLLCEALITARLEAYDALQNEFAGGFVPYTPKSDTILKAPRDLDEDDKFSMATITRELIEASPHTGKTWHDRLRLMPTICEQFGLPTDVRRLTKADIVDLMEKLARCPANKTQRFPELTWPQALEANKITKGPTLSPNSLKNAYFAPLTRILGYAEDKGHTPRNPARGVAVKDAKRTQRGTPFEIDELNAMLQLPQFTGCKSRDNVIEAGDVLLDDHWFWAPLIGLYTGARTSEIAQLKVSEVIFGGPAPYFRIQSDDERGVKTDASNRTVPIHRALLEIGFKEYVQRIKATGDRLFPDWVKPTANNGYADAASQRHFRRNVIPRISKQTSPRPNFHSFRHTMKSTMGACSIPQQHQNAILGHEQAGMDSVYLSRKFPIGVLADSMEKLVFSGLEVEHLFGTRTTVGKRKSAPVAA